MRSGRAAAPMIVLSLASACGHQAVGPAEGGAPARPAGSATKPAVAVTIPAGPDSSPWWTTTASNGGMTVTVVPADLLFAVGSAELSDDAEQVLGGLLNLALSMPTVRIEVDGFTDSDGTDAYNQRLSEDRADAVASWLGRSGVNPNRVTARGWGESRPIASNDDAAGKARNRRVEITLQVGAGGQR